MSDPIYTCENCGLKWYGWAENWQCSCETSEERKMNKICMESTKKWESITEDRRLRTVLIEHPDRRRQKVSGLMLLRELTESLLASDILLKTEEAKFAAFLDNCPFVSFMKNESGVFQHVNKAFLERFHLELSDIIGLTDYDMSWKAVADELRKNDKAAMTGNLVVTIERVNDTTWLVYKFGFKDGDNNQMLGGFGVDIQGLQSQYYKLLGDAQCLN